MQCPARRWFERTVRGQSLSERFAGAASVLKAMERFGQSRLRNGSNGPTPGRQLKIRAVPHCCQARDAVRLVRKIGPATPNQDTKRGRACVADGVQHPRCNSVLPMQSGSVVSSDMEIYCVWLIALFIAIILMAVLLPELGPPNRLVRRSGTSVRFSHDTLLQTNSKAQTQQRK